MTPIHNKINLLKCKKFCLLVIFLIFILPTCLSVNHDGTISLVIEFHKNDPTLTSLKSINYTETTYENFFTGKGRGNYSIKISDKTNNVLYSEKFNIIFLKYLRTLEGTIVEELNSSIKSFRLKRPEESYYIKFYKNNELELEIDLSEYLCDNNGECEKDIGENEYICPLDCQTISENVCGNGICETEETKNNCPEDCLEDINVDGEKRGVPWLFLGIFGGISIFILLIFLLTKKTSKKDDFKKLKKKWG